MGTEKRAHPRFPLILAVDYPGAASTVRDYTENLSAGGLFIRTDRDLREGQRLPLHVGFPGLLEPFEVEVEVVRRREAGPAGPAGVAVKIPLDRIDDRHKLARLAETARSGFGDPRRAFPPGVTVRLAHQHRRQEEPGHEERRGDARREAEAVLDAPGGQRAERDADEAAGGREQGGLEQELPLDVAPASGAVIFSTGTDSPVSGASSA